MSIIVPIDDALFSLATLHEAARLMRDDPARLTLSHLRHVACYSLTDAALYERKRDAALVQRTKALEQLSIPAPEPPEPPFVQQLIELLADALTERDARIKSLEAKVDALEAASAKNQPSPRRLIRNEPAA